MIQTVINRRDKFITNIRNFGKFP